jgi:prepilin-type N-terminal cleavage/methylation domain-containing protein
MIHQRSQRGFSLIELLLVVTIVAILAAVGVPSLIKARQAAEKGATVAVLRTVHTNQLMYYSHYGRYARLNELNTSTGNTLGTTVGTRIFRGSYFFILTPSPSDTSLKTRYQIVAYRVDRRFSIPAFLMNQSGTIQTLLP